MVKEPWENRRTSCTHPTGRVRWCLMMVLVGPGVDVLGYPREENPRSALVGPDYVRRATTLSGFAADFPTLENILSGVECCASQIAHAFGHYSCVSQRGITYPGYVCGEENTCGDRIAPGVIRSVIRDEKPGCSLQDRLREKAARYRTFLKEGAQ